MIRSLVLPVFLRLYPVVTCGASCSQCTESCVSVSVWCNGLVLNFVGRQTVWQYNIFNLHWEVSSKYLNVYWPLNLPFLPSVTMYLIQRRAAGDLTTTFILHMWILFPCKQDKLPQRCAKCEVDCAHVLMPFPCLFSGTCTRITSAT